MAQRKTLSEAQVRLLRWIGDGCPSGVMEGDSYRVSAAALRRRGLVTTAGHGPAWSASITEDGREYLARCDGPRPPVPRQANGSVTEQLVREVLAAGGSLLVKQRTFAERGDVDYGRRAGLAQQHGKVPRGKRLIVHRVSDQELRIDLVDVAEQAAGDRVPVPTRLTRPRPAVVAFREASDQLRMSRAVVPRAARILQGLVAEALRRGYEVTAPVRDQSNHPRRGWRATPESDAGVVSIVVDGHAFAVDVVEEGLPSRRWFDRRNGSYRRGRSGIGEWVPPSRASYEAGATGRLTISLLGYSASGRQGSWSDRKRWSVEERLPDVLREIEMRAVDAREREREEEHKAAERHRAWEQAMDRARAQLVEHRRIDALCDEVRSWQLTREIRAYCAAAEQAHGDVAATAEWVSSARGYADGIDPLQRPPQMPAEPDEIEPEDLKPYLGRRSPHGPDRAPLIGRR